MTVTLNGEKIQLSDSVQLLYLLEQYQLRNSSGIAVAVNEEVIAKEDWEAFLLSENDRILIIKATQGG